MESLKDRTARGVFWSFLDSFGVYLVKFGFSIAIARTLSPDDYGLMGMIIIFISLGQMIMQSGFSMSLIQKKECDTTDLSTAFWFNVLTAIVIYLVLFFSAGAISAFYQKPILINITRIASLGIIVNSLCSVQASILSRRMDFRKLTWINMTGALLSGSTGLLLALKGYEVWALVFQTLAGNIVYMIGLWYTSKWRPQWTFSTDSFKLLFSFGYKIFLQGLADVIFTKLYFPLIGKSFSSSQLGFYTNANRFYDLFVRQTSISFNRVLFPAFSTMQDEKERFNGNYIRAFHLIMALMFLGSMVLLISSRPFVSIALTEKWLPAVPFMMLFFIEGFFFPLLMFNQNTLCSVGKSGLSLKVDIVRKGATLLSIILLFKHGINALIIGQVASTGLASIISTATVLRIQGIRPLTIIKPLSVLLLIVAICLLFSFFVIEPITTSDWAELTLKCTFIPLLYVGLAAFFKLSAITEVKNLLRDHNLLH